MNLHSANKLKNIIKTSIALKETKLVIVLFCILIGNMAFSCIKEEVATNTCSGPYGTVRTLQNAQGSIGYDSINKQYVINIYIEGTIDGIITLYPCVLPEELKKVDLKIKISGKLFTNANLPKPQLGGQEIFYIDVTEVSKISN